MLRMTNFGGNNSRSFALLRMTNFGGNNNRSFASLRMTNFAGGTSGACADFLFFSGGVVGVHVVVEDLDELGYDFVAL